MVCQVWDYTYSSCCHKAQHIIKCVVAWPSGVEQYHTASLAELNDLHAGFVVSRINCCTRDSGVTGISR